MKDSEKPSPEELALEQQLRAMQPMSLPDETLDGLTQRLESTRANAHSALSEDNTARHSSHGEGVTRRAMLWAIAAILMIGLCLVPVYWPNPTPGEFLSSHQPATDEGDPFHTENQPVIGSVADPIPEEGESMMRNVRLTRVRDDGIVMSIGDTPMKRLRYEFVDTYTWATSRGSGQMRMEVPREDFVLVPVSTY